MSEQEREAWSGVRPQSVLWTVLALLHGIQNKVVLIITI